LAARAASSSFGAVVSESVFFGYRRVVPNANGFFLLFL
jgi:hypothetical protein